MGPNPHEQRGLEAGRVERASRLDRAMGREMSAGSRRIGLAIVLAVLLAILVLVVLGWLNLDALRPAP
jgi:hypothetical protein